MVTEELARANSEGSKHSAKGKAARAADAIAQRRDERRAAAEQRKIRQAAEVEEYGGCTASLHYHRSVKAFRAQLAEGKVVLPEYSPRADSRLSVVVRKRPLLPAERARQSYDCTTVIEPHAVVVHKPTGGGLHNTFVFDQLFDSTATSGDVYQHAVAPALGQLCQTVAGVCPSSSPRRPGAEPLGKLTVLAYGQTGSGKTHTMRKLTRNLP